jgi:type IV pilus biogenesis protein CpaD/CtpE
MAAGCTMIDAHRVRARLRRVRRSVRYGVLALSTLVLAACGQSMQTPLPDLSAKADPEGRGAMTRAEQKQAIDSLIAKRDAMKDPQPK